MSLVKCCSLLATAAFSLSLSLSAKAAAQTWPNMPSQLSLQTPYGALQVTNSGYIYEAQLSLAAQLIEPSVKGLINMPYAFQVGDSQSVLISVDSGTGACPVSYHWLTISQQGHQLSPAFGSCNTKIRVSHRDSTLIVQTPNLEARDFIDEYHYKAGKISLRKRRNTQINQD